MSKEVRGRIQVDESRICNMGFSNVKRLSYSTAYMTEELHIVNIPNITGTHRNLSIMGPAEKKGTLDCILDIFIQQIEGDFFYSNYSKPDTVLFHALASATVYYGGKIER